MRNLELKEVQNLEFEILKEFKKYCKEKKLDFFLVGGTLIGAIRHKGFIPWDDDIDVGMVRSTYNELCKIVEKNPYIDKEKRYKIVLPLHENNIYPFIKIYDTKTIIYEKNIKKKYNANIYVDLFPYDYASNSLEESKKIVKKHRFYKRMMSIAITDHKSKLKKIIYKLLYPIFLIYAKGDYKNITKKILRLPTAEVTKYIGNIVWLTGTKDMYKREWFEGLVEVEFEKEKFKAITGYHEYLTQFYGDYMKIPDEKDRVMHSFESYYKDEK